MTACNRTAQIFCIGVNTRKFLGCRRCYDLHLRIHNDKFYISTDILLLLHQYPRKTLVDILADYIIDHIETTEKE